MMDPVPLYPALYHPTDDTKSRDFRRSVRPYSRTERPTRYYYVDFGLSRKYNPSDNTPRELPIIGGYKNVPEFQGEGYDVASDPLATDIFYLGYLFQDRLIQVCRSCTSRHDARLTCSITEIHQFAIHGRSGCGYDTGRSSATSVDRRGRKALRRYSGQAQLVELSRPFIFQERVRDFTRPQRHSTRFRDSKLSYPAAPPRAGPLTRVRHQCCDAHRHRARPIASDPCFRLYRCAHPTNATQSLALNPVLFLLSLFMLSYRTSEASRVVVVSSTLPSFFGFGISACTNGIIRLVADTRWYRARFYIKDAQ